MRVMHIRQLEECVAEGRGPVLGMGTLDGVHLGHQEILRRVVARAAESGGPPAALTFAEHPLRVVRPADAPGLITPLPLKLAILERLGVELAVVIHFSPEIAALSAEAFVRDLLAARLRVTGIGVGYDFGFGRGRQGNVDLLAALAGPHGYWLDVVPPIKADGEVVSSRAIRQRLGRGDVAGAARALGRPYCVAGRVEPGAGRGTGLGFATANLELPEPRLVPDGVYAGRVLARGGFHDCMMNVGRGPTFAGGVPRLEVHIPGWTEPLYGETALVFFLARLRDEIRFPEASALVAQLARDREAAGAAWEAACGLPWVEWALQP
jgi:riboflavin kinase/FMN adenylyltransferase